MSVAASCIGEMVQRSLPFPSLKWVLEPALRFPSEAKASFLTLPGGASMIGVCAG